MEAMELVFPAAIAVPNLKGSNTMATATVIGGGDAERCDTGRSLVFSRPKMEKCSASITHRGSEYNTSGVESSSWTKKAVEDTIQLSTSDSLVVADGSEGNQSRKKERMMPRSSHGCFKIPQAPPLETSIFTSEDVDMKDVPDEIGSCVIKSAEKCQSIKVKNNLNGRRGDKRNRVPLNAKYDGLAGLKPTLGGNKLFGAYGLKADFNDITEVDHIYLNDVLDGSYKYPVVAKEKGNRLADTSESILHLVKRAISVIQPQDFSQFNKQYDEVQESCANTEAPSSTSDLQLYHPIDVIDKLAIPPSKDLDSLMQDAAKPAKVSRCKEPRLGKLLSHQAALHTFPWSQHGKTNSNSVKVSSRGSCPGKWIRIGKTSTFLGGGTKFLADLDSLAFDHNLVPSGSVKYILPRTHAAYYKISSTPPCEQPLYSSFICQTACPSFPDLSSPEEWKAAQALFDIANRTANGFIKWPKQSSQKETKSRKSKSVVSAESHLTPKSKVAFRNTISLIDCSRPLKKLKLSSSENKDHSNGFRHPHFWQTPKSNRSPPIRASREPTNSSLPMAPPRRALEKTDYTKEKNLRKAMQMEWIKGKGHL